MSVQTPVSADSQAALLQRIWVDCFRSVLGQVAGFPITVELETEEEFAVGEASGGPPGVWVLFTASKALHGEMAIVTSEAGALPFAQILMSEPPDPAVPFDQDRRDAYEEFLRQVVGQVATSLKSAAGGEVEITHSGGEAPSWPNASRLGIRIAGEKIASIRLVLVVTADLLGSFPLPKKPDAPAAPKAEQPGLPAARSSNLELLLDVTLDATIRFGQKQMLLRDILEFRPGYAITLDRQVKEPVELLIGDQMVARGEVVIVDGNYGLRITEIVSPQQRLESLRG